MKLDIKIILLLAIVAGAATFFWFMPGSGLQAAPQTTLTTIDGERINTKALQGSPYMVVFWATDCPGCIKEIPHLNELYSDLKGQGFKVLAIALPHDRIPQIETMRAQKGMNYDIVYDESGDLLETYGGIMVTPTNILVSPEGRIVYQKAGEFDPVQMRQRIEQLLPS